MNLSYLQIEANLKLASVKANDILVVWSRDLGSLAGIEISDFQIGTSSDFEWDVLQAYDFDEVVTFEGRWYQSLVAGIGTNTGNIPTNGLFWLQINKISGVIIPLWTPGLVTDHLTLFREGTTIFGLKNTAVLPYNSLVTPSLDPTNFEIVGGNTLQKAYDLAAQILTNAINGALAVQRGSALDTDNIYEGKNGAGTITFSVNGAGDIVVNNVTITNGDITFLTIGDGIFWGTNGDTGFSEASANNLAYKSNGATRGLMGNTSFSGSPTRTFNLRWANAGSESFPTYSYKDDTNTGDYSPAPDTRHSATGGIDALTIDASQNVTIPNGKLKVTDRIALGLTVGDVATPLEGEEWYNDTLEKFRANEGGVVKNSIPAGGETIYPLQFEISSDAPTSSFSLFTGHIEVDDASEQLSGKLTDATYQTSLDDGDTLINHATLTILQTWIDANITLPGTDFLLRTIGVYAALKIGEAQVKFNYQIA